LASDRGLTCTLSPPSGSAAVQQGPQRPAFQFFSRLFSSPRTGWVMVQGSRDSSRQSSSLFSARNGLRECVCGSRPSRTPGLGRLCLKRRCSSEENLWILKLLVAGMFSRLQAQEHSTRGCGGHSWAWALLERQPPLVAGIFFMSRYVTSVVRLQRRLR